MPWVAEGQHHLPKTSTVILARHLRYEQDLAPSSPLLCASSGLEGGPCGTGRTGHHDIGLPMGWAASAHQAPIIWPALPAMQPPAVLTPITRTHWASNTSAHTCSLTLRCCPAHWQQIWENVKFLLFWEAQWDSLSTQLHRKMPLISEARQPDPWSFIGRYFDSVTDEIT